MKLQKSTIQLLRIPFSIVLLPVFLYALYNSKEQIAINDTIIVFIVIHFIFYPASNAYNSYMDKDEGSIGGLKNPLPATRQLFTISNILDSIGLIISLLISPWFAIINLFLIILSRLYSWTRVRIKKYAIPAFIMVAFAQGALSYINITHGISDKSIDILLFSNKTLIDSLVAALFVGSIYPITQIYQHDLDRMSGVKSISMLLGIKGTLIFSSILFVLSFVLIYFRMPNSDFVIFLLFMVFPFVYFLNWLIQVWKDISFADYKHAMNMIVTASISMIIGLLVIIFRYFF